MQEEFSEVLARLDRIEKDIDRLLEKLSLPSIQKVLAEEEKHLAIERRKDELLTKSVWTISDISLWSGLATSNLYTGYKYLLPNWGEPQTTTIVRGRRVSAWFRDDVVGRIPRDRKGLDAGPLLEEYEKHWLGVIREKSRELELEEAVRVIKEAQKNEKK